MVDLVREPNFGSLETMVGMTGASSTQEGGADIRPRPLHHRDMEPEELPRGRSIGRPNAETMSGVERTRPDAAPGGLVRLNPSGEGLRKDEGRLQSG